MRILTRYFLKQHLGPFIFSLIVLTSLLFINAVARRFEDLALVLALIPDVAKWTATERTALDEIIRAKSEADESRYAKLLQRHARLREALINLGEPAD